jgi:hypothetical protein
MSLLTTPNTPQMTNDKLTSTVVKQAKPKDKHTAATFHAAQEYEFLAARIIGFIR